MVNEMVRSTGLMTVEDDQSWRFGEQPHGTVSVSLYMPAFQPTTSEGAVDTAKRDKYITGYAQSAQTLYIKSGLPLARITSGDGQGQYGPYDPDATDGRAAMVSGLLESMIQIKVTVSGWEVVNTENVGLRFRGDIVKRNLPVVPADDAVWAGEFFDVENDVVTRLFGNAGSSTATVTVDSITDATDTGKALLKAASSAAALTAIGAQGALGNGSVTESMIASDAVTTTKIKDKAVTAAKVADGVIQSGS